MICKDRKFLFLYVSTVYMNLIKKCKAFPSRSMIVTFCQVQDQIPVFNWFPLTSLFHLEKDATNLVFTSMGVDFVREA